MLQKLCKCEHSMTSRRCDKTVSCHGGVLDVTLSRVTLSGNPSLPMWDPRPRGLGSRMHGRDEEDRIQKVSRLCRAYCMSDPRGSRPVVSLDLDDQTLRYDAYHADVAVTTHPDSAGDLN